MSTTLYLLRHGETEENAKHILQGHLPGKLTPNGMEQARKARETFKEINIDIMLCSDLQRCVDTANIVNEALHLHIITTPLLRERDWGSATGMTVDGITKIAIPKDAETVEAMGARARIFLDYVKSTYPNKRILAISHGLFCRCIQAVHKEKEIAEIERMGNAECRVLEL